MCLILLKSWGCHHGTLLASTCFETSFKCHLICCICFCYFCTGFILRLNSIFQQFPSVAHSLKTPSGVTMTMIDVSFGELGELQMRDFSTGWCYGHGDNPTGF